MSDPTPPPLEPSPEEIAAEPRKVRRLNSLPVFLVLSVFLLLLATIGIVSTRQKPRPAPIDPAEEPAEYSSAEELRRRAELERRAQEQRPLFPGSRERPVLPPRELPEPTRPQTPENRQARIAPILLPSLRNLPSGARPPAGPGGLRGTPEEPIERSGSRAVPAYGPSGLAAAASEARPTERDELYGAAQAERFRDRVAGQPRSDPVLAVRTPATSPYELKQGAVIPAILQTTVNSDLSGPAKALVQRDVYDSLTGYRLLIPRGSVLLGEYNQRVVWGERRILFAWTRLLFPDGSSLDLGALPGADGLGAAGLKDRVNNHLGRVYTSALLLSVVGAGFQISQDTNDDVFSQDPSATQIAGAAVAQELARTSNEVLRRNLNVKPTLEARIGLRFVVHVTRDFAFSESYRPLAPGARTTSAAQNTQ